MARKNTPTVNGEVYHVFNRGVEKREIFLEKNDYLRLYQSLYLFNDSQPVLDFRHAIGNKENSQGPLVQIHAYSILPNHFHLILKQVSDSGISEFMKRIGGGYTSYFNKKYNRSGVLFQGKYKKVHIENSEQYRYVFAYVNENHEVHNIKRDTDMCYSSSRHFQGLALSKAIGIKDETYDHFEAKRLAIQINQKRTMDANYLID